MLIKVNLLDLTKFWYYIQQNQLHRPEVCFILSKKLQNPIKTLCFNKQLNMIKGVYFFLDIQGVLQKSISSFEGQYPTFSFNKNHQNH